MKSGSLPKLPIPFPYQNRIRSYAKHHASFARRENIRAERAAKRVHLVECTECFEAMKESEAIENRCYLCGATVRDLP
jgi:hypothetical protein